MVDTLINVLETWGLPFLGTAMAMICVLIANENRLEKKEDREKKKSILPTQTTRREQDISATSGLPSTKQVMDSINS